MMTKAITTTRNWVLTISRYHLKDVYKRQPFTPEEYENYRSYVERGGNLIILGEPKRQAFMNPVVEELGLRFSDGVLVAPSKQYLADIIAANVMEGALEASPYFEDMIRRGQTVITPSACACLLYTS